MSLKPELEALLQQQFAPAHLEVLDDSARHAGHAGARAGGGHYVVTVVSEKFAGHTLLERHRMVYAALGDRMRAQIHALALTTRTPEEWARR